jgi:hypothetical protein
MSLLPLHLLHHRQLLLTVGCLLSLASLAAPTTEAPGALETSPASAVPLGAAGTRPSARNSDTRTIDLLVEMQQPTAGLQFNERAGRSTSRDVATRPAQALTQTQTQTPAQQPQAEAPLTPPSGLFGSGATPAVQARTQNLVDRSSSSDAMPARHSGRSSPDVPPEVKRWLLWPREIVEYVRENRAWVVGCTAMLLVMAWTGSMMFSRRRG